MEIFESGNHVILKNLKHFGLSDIFDCGQCFRFDRVGESESFAGVAFGKYLAASQSEEGVYLETSLADFNGTWRRFFDLDRDYQKIFEQLCQNETLKQAAQSCPGLRILRQEPFECLISFIISQNNNIPRIKKIIGSLCENFGEKITQNGRIYHAFPTPEKLASLSPSELMPIKSGFRAKYILDAATKVASGEIDLDAVYAMKGTDGLEYLKKIKGVGDKVAACVLLFSYNKLETFPVDVWIGRVLEKYYPNTDYTKLFGEFAGIANSYLFYYERTLERNGGNKP